MVTKRFRVYVACVVVLLLLNSCATRISSDALAKINRFGVVSVAADTFSRTYVGFTVFGNEREHRDVTAWGLDRVYADGIGNAAAKVLKATYVPAGWSVTQFAVVNDQGPDWPKIESAVKAYCQANAIDTLLVLAKLRSGDSIGRTNQILEPMGLYASMRAARLYISMVLGVVDCATGKRVASQVVMVLPTGIPAPPELPRVQVPVEIGKRSLAEWDAATERDIRAGLLTVPGDAWEQTLRRLTTPPADRPNEAT